MKTQWDTRYSEEDYAYGTEPNEFFKLELDKLEPGRILIPGDGEGRNSVYAASKGWEVDAIDWSEEARKKAMLLARKNNVLVNYVIDDLTTFTVEREYYDAAALIFVHLGGEDREYLHREVLKGLKPGGILIIEAFDKDQIGNSSGGPKDPELLYSLQEIVEEFIDMDIKHLSREQIELNEGKYHKGKAIVVRFVGQKK